jgi:hypothetical protein
MFVRVFRPKEQKEILVNVNSVWKIEVSYTMPDKGPHGWVTNLKDGLENPDAVRWYTVFVGSEEITLPANPNDPVVKLFEEIYKNAVKG